MSTTVLRAESFVNEVFLVHAGDTYIHSDEGHDTVIKRTIEASERLQPDAVFLTKEVEDPKNYGVAETLGAEEDGLHKVVGVEEKPDRPRSNLATEDTLILANTKQIKKAYGVSVLSHKDLVKTV